MPQINAADSHGRTPLFDASRVGNLDVARALLGSGADQSIKDLHGRTPLLVAWQNGHSDLVTLLRDDGDSKSLVLESLPEDSSLPLWSMAKLGHTVLLRDALNTENPNTCPRDPDMESTALHWAIHTNNLEIAEILLKAGSSIDEVNDYKRTALHIAAYMANYEATELLLQFKANPDIRDSWHLTPLSIALTRDAYFIAVRLLEAGAAIEQGVRQRDLQETFCAAVQMGLIGVAKRLVNHGVNLEGRNADGKTALELANDSANGTLLEWLRQLIYKATDRSPNLAAESPTGDADHA